MADTDRNRPVEYRRNLLRLLLYALTAFVIGVFVLAFTSPRDDVHLAGWVLSVFGGLGVLWVLWRVLFPGKPLLRLSPQGVDWYNGTSDVRIPWSEIVGVDTADFQVRVRSGRKSTLETFRDITMVSVSQDFHDRYIDPGSSYSRGPYWEVFVRPYDGHMAVALHHDTYKVTPAQVREPLETRWLAFRNREAAAETPGDDRFGRGPLVFGGASDMMSRKGAVMVGLPVAVCLFLFANMAGLWETGGQKAQRLQREAFDARRATSQQQSDEMTRRAEERQERWEQIWSDFDASFERTRPDPDLPEGR